MPSVAHRRGDDPWMRTDARLCGWSAAALFVLYVVAAARFPLPGLWHDDGLYVQLGHALTRGAYTLEQLPGDPVQRKYPPLHPALLAVVWLTGADPHRAWWPFCLPGALGAACGAALWYRWLRVARLLKRGPAATIAALSALAPATVMLASSAMSEPVVTPLLPLVLLLLDRASGRRGARNRDAAHIPRGPQGEARAAMIAGVLLGLGVLARPLFLIQALAAVVWLATRGRRADAARLATTVTIVSTPWWIWLAASTHARGSGVSAFSYYLTCDKLLPASPADLAATIAQRAPDLVTATGDQWLGARLVPEIAAWLGAGGGTLGTWLATAAGALALAGLALGCRRGIARAPLATVVALATAVIAVVYPFASWRYLVPLLPVTLLAFHDAAAWIAAQVGIRRAVWHALAVVGGLSAAVTTTLQLQPDPEHACRMWSDTFDTAAHRSVAAWLREHTPPDAVIACDLDPCIWIATGRRCLMFANTDLALVRRPECCPAIAHAVTGPSLADWRALGVTHVVTHPGVDPPILMMVDALVAEGTLAPVFSPASPGHRVLALR